ncbi:hypothetical protein AMELA_G00104000 [Ameiurus melas]|uniref:Uncharacterized protein n=1 Tax=Ameiurus melas TaxID=219545 RepID=A0A7J6ATL2_AMEME|nr:hypothetical protein AMELA_G00104000 [Ameiurus melas]
MYASAFPFSFPFFNSPVIFNRLGNEDWGEYFHKGGKREPRTSCQSLKVEKRRCEERPKLAAWPN